MFPAPRSLLPQRAFTLVEMLMVICLIGVLAAVILPTGAALKPNPAVIGAQQLLSDIGHARQLALSQHATVCMVFVPPGVFCDSSALSTNWPESEQMRARNLLDKQMVGYNFICLRTAADQPGHRTAHYLDNWKSLPPGAFISGSKFGPATQRTDVYTVDAHGSPQIFASFNGFHTDDIFPFPSEQTPAEDGHWAALPYIAFNSKGQLVQLAGGQEQSALAEIIPLARGSVLLPRDPVTRAPEPGPVSGLESPPGNSTMQSFNLITIDALTGKAVIQRQGAK